MRIEVPPFQEMKIRSEEGKVEIILNEGSKIWLSCLSNDVDIEIIHRGKNSFSRVVAGTIVRDGEARMKAILRIDEEAEGSDGRFELRALNLGEATIIQEPLLDVNNRNVKAGHSASIERPGEEEMFYLRTRGIRDPEAILVEAFRERVLSFMD